MPSTYTVNKSIEQPASGSYQNAWAAPVNADWSDIDNAFGGHSSINVTGVGGGTYGLSLAQYQPPNLEFIGTLTASLTYVLPAGVGGLWSISNGTAGAFSLTFGVTGGGTFVLPQGQRSFIVCDGINVGLAQTPTLPTTGLPFTSITGTIANGQIPTGLTLNSPTLTGSPVAPTEAVGNNSTSLATTAFVQAAIAQIPAVPTFRTGQVFPASGNGTRYNFSTPFTTLLGVMVCGNTSGATQQFQTATVLSEDVNGFTVTASASGFGVFYIAIGFG